MRFSSADETHKLLYAGLPAPGHRAPPLDWATLRFLASRHALWRLALTGSTIDLRMPRAAADAAQPIGSAGLGRLLEVVDPASMDIAVRLATYGSHALAATARVQTCSTSSAAEADAENGALLPRRAGFPRCLDAIQWPPAQSIQQGRDWAAVGLLYEYRSGGAVANAARLWLPARPVEPTLTGCTATVEHDALNQDWFCASLLADVALGWAQSEEGAADGDAALSPLSVVCGAEVSTSIKTLLARPAVQYALGLRWEGLDRRDATAAAPAWSDATWSVMWRSALPGQNRRSSTRPGAANVGSELAFRYDGRDLPPALLNEDESGEEGELVDLFATPPRLAAALRVWSEGTEGGDALAGGSQLGTLNLDAAVVYPLSKETELRARVGFGALRNAPRATTTGTTTATTTNAHAGAAAAAGADGAPRGARGLLQHRSEICIGVTHRFMSWLQVRERKTRF